MGGTAKGGKKAMNTIILRYGADYYTTIGRKGGEVSRGGGFTGDSDLARKAGRKGGAVTRTSCFKGHPYTPDTPRNKITGYHECAICKLAAKRRQANQRWKREKAARISEPNS